MTAIWWIRRDFRLADNAALMAAAQAGAVVPVVIYDAVLDQLGAAPKWRMGEGLAHLERVVTDKGGRIIWRRGKAAEALCDIARATGATSVHWNRLYDRDSIARDTEVKEQLKDAGLEAQSHAGHILFEPWTVETGQGGPYRVYSPFWRAVKDTPVPTALPAPDLTWPETWPDSDSLTDWALGAAMRRGAAIVARHACVGEAAALDRLDAFIDGRVAAYKDRRDFPAEEATSRLSENLTYGEISPRTIWHAGQRAMAEGARGAEHFLKELVWREFAYHLNYHYPDLDRTNFREGWDAFPWRGDSADAEAWRRGMTGEPFVDAAMREAYVTGTMHNRARMIVASYLTKHLLTDWRVGLEWFAEILTDWDPASNAMGWQWVAGSGPDAAPYFRVFNPAGQAEKFDPSGTYLDRWLAEDRKVPTDTALSYFDAVPKAWGLRPDAPYPARLIALDAGRKRALEAYEAR